MNKIILIIAIILIVIVGGYFLLREGYQTPTPTNLEITAPQGTSGEVFEIPQPGQETPVATEVKEITVIGTEFAFSPFSITVLAGEKVKLTFKNNGQAPHNLAIKELGISTKTIGGGQTDTIAFTAPASGIFTFFCSIPGHRSSGMEGNLKVE